MSTIQTLMADIGKRARIAASVMATASTTAKNKALTVASEAILAQQDVILAANETDIALAKEKALDAAMIDRLTLNPNRIAAIAKGLCEVAVLEDPVGKILSEWDRPNGLHIKRISVPLGVIGIIYESRPNVTADAGALSLKAGNVAILRSGSESSHSSAAIITCLHQGLEAAGLPKDAILFIPTQDREAVGLMLTMNGVIDVIIPRGGKTLCQRVQEESRVPTLLHLEGNCHTYIHSEASIDTAVKVVHNAKLRRTGICGATESLVIDRAIAATVLPKIVDSLTAGHCEIRGDNAARTIDNRIVPAADSDWDTEYLSAIISVKIVEDLREAIAFINTHGSHHTDAIITQNQKAADDFVHSIDSAIVMHNTSTQFADGGEFGMGAEIGIATGRLHARGPVGVEQLTTYKYIVSSNGATRPS
jgi:glutamate-5-semialdehyde dehydrogenase